MFGYIYKITMPNGRCYVGSKKKRFFDENYWSSSCNPEFWRDLEFYGKENCKREVLEWIENKEKIGEREDYWILHENAFINCGGYNLAKSCHPFYQTKETIEKIKKSNIEYNKKLTQEQKDIRKIKCRQRMLNPNGVFQSKEYKEKMSKSLKKSIKKRGGIYNKGKNKENNIGMKKMSETKKKMHWYTNNIIEVFCKQCPNGFHLGRKKYSPKAIENIRAAAKDPKRREKISKAKKSRNNFNNSTNVD